MKLMDGGRLAQPVLWLCARGSIAALALLSWMPGEYMVRTGVLSGREEHFLAYMISAVVVFYPRPRLSPASLALFYVLLAECLRSARILFRVGTLQLLISSPAQPGRSSEL